MNKSVKKIAYIAPVVVVSATASAFAQSDEASWTWSQFAGNVAGGAAGGAAGGVAATAIAAGVPVPGAGAAAAAGAVAGAVGGAASYSLTVAFG